MILRRYDDPAEFVRRATAALEAHEAENNLALGIANGVAGGDYSREAVFLATVEHESTSHGGAPAAVTLRTPPFPVLVAYTPEAGDPEVVRLVTEALYDAYGSDIAGFNADGRVVRHYVDAWTKRTGRRARLHQSMRVYRLTRVRPPSGVSGSARRARAEDHGTLIEFVSGFYRDALPDEYDPQRVVEMVTRLTSPPAGQRGLFVWEVDGRPVSMAAYSGPTPHGIRIVAVYTPPEERGHGYASACVAELSARLLAEGRDYCFLFTDLANPTSNSIYQKIGYEPVSDHEHWKLAEWQARDGRARHADAHDASRG